MINIPTKVLCACSYAHTLLRINDSVTCLVLYARALHKVSGTDSCCLNVRATNSCETARCRATSNSFAQSASLRWDRTHHSRTIPKSFERERFQEPLQIIFQMNLGEHTQKILKDEHVKYVNINAKIHTNEK